MDQTHHNILLYIIYLSNSLIFKSFLIVYLIIYQGLLNSTTLHIINYILINNTRHLSTCPNQLTEVFIIFSVIGATSTLSLLLSFLILESSLRTHSMQHLHHLHLLYLLHWFLTVQQYIPYNIVSFNLLLYDNIFLQFERYFCNI